MCRLLNAISGCYRAIQIVKKDFFLSSDYFRVDSIQVYLNAVCVTERS